MTTAPRHNNHLSSNHHINKLTDVPSNLKQKYTYYKMVSIFNIFHKISQISIPIILIQLVLLREGGYFQKICTCMCLSNVENQTFSIPIFCLIPTHQYTVFERKAPNFDQIGCFSQQFAHDTPNLCNLGSFVSDENLPIAIPNFAKKRPKRQVHIRIPCQCENPHPRGILLSICHGTVG